MTEPDTITRKEIAALACIHEDTVVAHEKEWGLKSARCRKYSRPILYWRKKALETLAKHAVISL